MTSEPNRAQRRVWPKRRQWTDRIATDNRLTHGAKAWLGLLARRSDDAGKPVWGNQKKMGEQIGRCDRSVRRYRLEAEELGYVKTYRAKPQQGPGGQIVHQRSNTYCLCLPAREKATQPAPRRRERAPYCVVGSAGSRRRHRADSDDRPSPFGVSQPRRPPPGECESGGSAHPKTKLPPGWWLVDDTPEGVTATEEAYRRPEPGEAAHRVAQARLELTEARGRAQLQR